MRLESRLAILIISQLALGLALGFEHGWIIVAVLVLCVGGIRWYTKRPSRSERYVLTMLGGVLQVTTPEGRVQSLAVADIDELVVEKRPGAHGANETWWIASGDAASRCEFPILATGSEAFEEWLDSLEGADTGAYSDVDATGVGRGIYWKRSTDWKAPERPACPQSEPVVPPARDTLGDGAKFVFYGTLSSVMLLRGLGVAGGKPIIGAGLIALIIWSVLVYWAMRRQSAGDGWTLALADGQLRVTDLNGRQQTVVLANVRAVTLESRHTFVHGWHKVWVVDAAERCVIPDGTANEFDILDWLRTQPGFDKAAENALFDSLFEKGRSVPRVVWTRS